MKRNTYVTAALFVVFGLLTVIYMNMDRLSSDDMPPITTTLGTRNPEDLPTMADSEDCEEECDESADTDVMADADVDDADKEECEEECDDAAAMTTDEDCEEECDDNLSSSEVMSRIDSLRAEMELGRAEQVAALTEIIASADFSAETKSQAKDSLNDLQALASSSRMLETVISHVGFEDVLVRASADHVQVTIQVATMDDVPTREALVELYILAGIEFGSHRNGNISIDFQPLN